MVVQLITFQVLDIFLKILFCLFYYCKSMRLVLLSISGLNTRIRPIFHFREQLHPSSLYRIIQDENNKSSSSIVLENCKMNSCELVLLSFLILLQKGRILMKYCMDHTPDIDRPSYKLYFMYNTHFSLFVSFRSDFFASIFALIWY